MTMAAAALPASPATSPMARCKAQGYLYAVRPEGGDVSRIKLGSTMSPDPVLALHDAYDRGFGRTDILWLMPCSDVRRDEIGRMHDYFSDRRVWGRRELFSFDSLEEFQDEIDTFEGFLGIWLGGEARPPVIEDLSAPNKATAPQRRKKTAEAHSHLTAWAQGCITNSLHDYVTVKDAYIRYRHDGGTLGKIHFASSMRTLMNARGLQLRLQSTRQGEKVNNFWDGVTLNPR